MKERNNTDINGGNDIGEEASITMMWCRDYKRDSRDIITGEGV